MSTTTNVIIQTDVTDLQAAVERWWPRRKLTPHQAAAIRAKYSRHDVRAIATALGDQFAENPDATKPDWTDIGRRLAAINPRTAARAATDEDVERIGQFRATVKDWLGAKDGLAGVANDLLIGLDAAEECTTRELRRERIEAVADWCRYADGFQHVRIMLTRHEHVGENGRRYPSGVRYCAQFGDGIVDQLQRAEYAIRRLIGLGPATNAHVRATLDAIQSARSELAYVQTHPVSSDGGEATPEPEREDSPF